MEAIATGLMTFVPHSPGGRHCAFVRRAVLLMPLMLVGCAGPSQPDSFCTSNDDCPERHICSSFTRLCVLDVHKRPADYALWGAFSCQEIFGAGDAVGYMRIGFVHEIYQAFGGQEPAPADPASFYTMGLQCNLFDYTAASDAWMLFAGVIDPTSSEVNNLIIVLDEDNFHAGATQTEPLAAFYTFAISDSQNNVLWGSQHGEIRVQQVDADEHPYTVRGEFFARLQ